jgi:hypothetical protein
MHGEALGYLVYGLSGLMNGIRLGFSCLGMHCGFLG